MNKERKNIINKRFGRLLVLKQSNKKLYTKTGNQIKGRVFKCKCDCGNIIYTHYSALNGGNKLSCGCLGTGGHNLIDIDGERFGKLVVLKRVAIPKKYKDKGVTSAFWKCKCDCGNITIVSGTSLRGGTKSCGCLARLNEKYNMIGKKFGELEVIGQESSTKKGLAVWKCKCSCGTELNVTGSYLRQERIKSCGCLRNKTDKERNKTYNDLYYGTWNAYMKGAEARNLEFSITIEYAYSLYENQNKKCALSGVPIKLYPMYTGNTTASLDRIDSNKGYTKNNIQWVHKDLNRLKMNMDNDKFIEWCTLVAKHNS